MKRLPIPFCYYGELAQKLPISVLEQIVRASRQIAENYHISIGKNTFTEKGSDHELSYAEYNEMRYLRMIEMLAPAGITENQIAAWDLSIDQITRKYLHFVPSYNLLTRLKAIKSK